MEIFEDEYKSNLKDEILDSSAELEIAYSARVPSSQTMAAPLGTTKVMHLGVELDPNQTYARSTSKWDVSMHKSTLKELSKPRR